MFQAICYVFPLGVLQKAGSVKTLSKSSWKREENSGFSVGARFTESFTPSNTANMVEPRVYFNLGRVLSWSCIYFEGRQILRFVCS